MERYSDILEEALDSITRLSRDGAKVHSITNTVTQGFTANVLLACGASPSMTVNPDEVENFTGSAHALHINLGTLDAPRIEAILRSVAVAADRKLPVILDPVMAHVSPLRCDFAKALAADRPLTVKANAEEAVALDLESKLQKCLVITGPVDRIVCPDGEITIANGDPMLAKLVGTGCALGALIAALAAQSESIEIACLAALAWLSVAGEIAAKNSSGPGSFQPALLDELHNLQTDQIRERVILKIISMDKAK